MTGSPSSQSSQPHPVTPRVLATMASAATFFIAYPPLYGFLRRGAEGLFKFVSGDALLYLTIARNSQKGFYSFDGETVTNGFHPLWQWVLTFAFRFVDPNDTEAHMVLSLALGTTAVILGVLFSGLAIYRYTGSIFLGLLTIPGLYHVLQGVVYENGAVWQNCDGMEDALSTLFGGLLLFVMAGSILRSDFTEDRFLELSGRNPLVQMGAVLPFVILSRLDDVFLLVGFSILFLTMTSRPVKDRVRAATILCMPAALTIVLYMIYNQITVGSALPLSGRSKAGDSLFSSAYVFATALFPPIIDLKNALVAKQSDGISLYFGAFRPMQMLFPALIAAAFMLLRRVYYRREPRFWLPIGFCIYIWVKAVYNLYNVNLWHQAHWYYGLFLVLSTFLIAVLLGDVYARLTRHLAVRVSLYALLAMWMLTTAGRVAARAGHFPPTPEYLLWKDRDVVSRELHKVAGNANLIEFDDGILNFALEQSAIHGFAFAVDAKSYEAKARGQLLRHAFERGYNLFASVGYITVPNRIESSDKIRDFLKTTFLEPQIKDELDAFDYEMVYLHDPSDTAFIRFVPRAVADRARSL